MGNRQSTFGHQQIGLLLPEILSQLHRLNNRTDRFGNALSLALSSVSHAHTQIADQGRLISELHSRPSVTIVDRNVVIEVVQQYLLPMLQNEMVTTIQTVAATVMTRMGSTQAAATQDLPERQFTTVSASTDDLPHTPERVMISSATQTEDNDDVVVMSMITGVDTPHVPCDNSEMPQSAETANNGSVATEPSDESVNSPSISAGQSFPTSGIRVLEVEVPQNPPVVDQGLADTDAPGMTISFVVTLFYTANIYSSGIE